MCMRFVQYIVLTLYVFRAKMKEKEVLCMGELSFQERFNYLKKTYCTTKEDIKKKI